MKTAEQLADAVIANSGVRDKLSLFERLDLHRCITLAIHEFQTLLPTADEVRNTYEDIVGTIDPYGITVFCWVGAGHKKRQLLYLDGDKVTPYKGNPLDLFRGTKTIRDLLEGVG